MNNVKDKEEDLCQNTSIRNSKNSFNSKLTNSPKNSFNYNSSTRNCNNEKYNVENDREDFYDENNGECLHEELDGEYCIGCGECLKECELVDEYRDYTTNFQINSKFNIKDLDFQLKKKIDNILISTNFISYKKKVLYYFKSKIFIGRISLTDKVLLILYNLFNIESFPVTVNDLVKFSSMSKYKFLKFYRNNFKFIKRSTSYYFTIFQRAEADIFKNFNVNSTVDFKEFEELALKHPSSNSFDLCCTFILSKSNFSKDLKISKYFRVHYNLLKFIRK